MAIAARPAITKAAKENLKRIEPPGNNIFKQAELAIKYKNSYLRRIGETNSTWHPLMK